jgi:CRP-like cAMP-binding protein
MTVTNLEPIIAQHPFFAGLDPEFIDTVVGCAANARYNVGDYLVRDGDAEDSFFLIRAGRVAIELDVHHQPTVVATLTPGEILGWSWLVPPLRWYFDARAVELTRVLRFDGTCLREKCEANPALGFEIVKRCASDVEQRLYRAWHQMVDVYGPAGG